MTRPPIVIGSLAMLWGYTRSAVQRKERYGDNQFRESLRRFQWQCLLKGKTKATEQLNAEQAAHWRQSTLATVPLPPPASASVLASPH